LKTGQIYLYLLYKKTVGSLGYLDRVVQLWVSAMMLNVHSNFCLIFIYLNIRLSTVQDIFVITN